MRYSVLLAFIILFLWTVYRYFFRFPEWTDELIAKPLLFFIPVYFVIKFKEKNQLNTIGLVKKNLIKNILLGIGAGLLLLQVYVLTILFKYGALTIHTERFQGIELVWIIVLPVITGFLEEVVFRGYFLTRYERVFKNVAIAVLLSTFLFILIHLPLYYFVYHYSFIEILVAAGLLMQLSIINSILYVYTKTVAASSATHIIWNFGQTILR